jgi:hypothetical protein
LGEKKKKGKERQRLFVMENVCLQLWSGNDEKRSPKIK